MAQDGRIKGPSLYQNLERHGVNLKFSNELNDPVSTKNNVILYLDVTNNRIGVNVPRPNTPFTDLYSPGTFKADDVSATSTGTIGNFDFTTESISLPANGDIILDSVISINLPRFETDNLIANNNYLETKNNNNIVFDPAGTGTTEILANLNTQGDIYATGTITADGSISFGNNSADVITIGGQIVNGLIPAQGGNYNIGSSTKRFGTLYSPLLNGTTIQTGAVILPNFQAILDLPYDNMFFVAQNGDDTNDGNHPQNPFRTIKAALSASDSSVAGPVAIHIYPGTYEEEFPLTIPTNTALIGTDIRNCIVKPAAGYEGNDVFLLNGETTIQNLTIKKDPPNLSFVLDNPNDYDTTQDDNFGRSVGISESYTIVGAPNEDDTGGSTSGKAYIYDTTTGNLLYTLDNPSAYGTSAYDNFGSKVAISESYAIVGAFQEDDNAVGGGTGSASGKAYIYDLSTLTPGTVTSATFVLDNPNAYNTSQNDWFGLSVAISESHAIVGAFAEDDSNANTNGKAYLYDLSTLTPGTITNATHVLNNPNPNVSIFGDEFGYSVGISESYAIVGARREDDAGGSDSGKAYVYDTATGNLLYTLDNPNAYDTSANDNFGWDVSISESYAIVGAPSEDESGNSNSGKAYVYDTATGNLLYTLDNPNAYDTSANDNFGNCVSITNSYAIVSTPYEDESGNSNSGKAYVYDTATGNLLYTLDNPNAYDTSANDNFGWSVSISESYAIVGAPFEDDDAVGGGTGSASGKAYIFKLVSTTAAFRFAPDAIVSTRSPYIQNCSVIFNHTPALNSLQENYYESVKGALVDGADVDPNSNEASMLFHSCTFITPYSDALVATNGSRVEWLNSFTYFANRGIYAYNGTTGHLSSDGSTIKYGAEIRSIGSACVYGNYGIVGDGNEVLVYAINHNLAYIGTGTSTDNDPTNVIPSNKIVKQNNAKIYYQSQDHTGNFSVGDSFYVNLEDGTSSISNASFEQVASIEISNAGDPTEVTTIFPSEINVGNFLISNNSIETLSQNFNINAAGTLELENVDINDNLSIVDMLTVHGNLDVTGNITFNSRFTSDVISTEGLALSNTVSIGFTNQGYGRSVDISESYFIVGSPSASVGTSGGAGRAYLYDTSNNVIDILNPVYTGGSTGGSDNFGINVAMNTNYSIVGAQFAKDVNNSSIRTGAAYIFNNTDGSLHLTLVDQNPESDGRFGYAVDVNETYAIVGAWKQTAGVLAQSGRAYIYEISTGNFVRSHDGTGYVTYFGQAVSISENYYIIGEPNKFGSRGRAYLYAIDGTLIATLSSPNAQQFGSFGVSVAINESVAVVGAYYESTQGNVYVFDVTNGSLLHTIPNPNIEPTTTSQDGFGIEVAVTDNFIIAGTLYEDANATDSGTVYIFDISTGNLVDSISGTSANQQFGSGIGANSNKIIIGANGEARARVYQLGGKNLGSTSLPWKELHINNIDLPNIEIYNNIIEATSGNLELKASGTGLILFDTDNFAIQNGLTVSQVTDLNTTNITNNSTITGNIDLIGDITVTNLTTDNINIDVIAQFKEVRFIDNDITTISSNADLEFRAAGTGIVIIDDPVEVANDLYLGGQLNSASLTVQNATTSPRWTTKDILLFQNYITTLSSNSNLEFRAQDGNVAITGTDFYLGQNIFVNSSSTFTNTTTTNLTTTGNIQISQNIITSGKINTQNIETNKNVSFENISIEGNLVRTTLSNSDLEFKTAGAGNIRLTSLNLNNDISANILFSDLNDFNLLQVPEFQTNNIRVFDNVIETTISNSDLEIRSANDRILITPDILLDQYTLSSLSGNLNLSTDNVIMSSMTSALLLSRGDTSQRQPVTGMIRFNTESNLFEGYTDRYIGFNGVYSPNFNNSVLAHLTNDILNFTYNTNIVTTLDSQKIVTHGLRIDEIEINDNTIRTSNSNADIEFRIGSNKNLAINDFTINDNSITQTNSQATNFEVTGLGYSKISGTVGIRLPLGTTSTRTISRTGQLRYNTTISDLEIFDGSKWDNPQGDITPISEEDLIDEAFINSLILG